MFKPVSALLKLNVEIVVETDDPKSIREEEERIIQLALEVEKKQKIEKANALENKGKPSKNKNKVKPDQA